MRTGQQNCFRRLCKKKACHSDSLMQVISASTNYCSSESASSTLFLCLLLGALGAIVIRRRRSTLTSLCRTNRLIRSLTILHENVQDLVLYQRSSKFTPRHRTNSNWASFSFQISKEVQADCIFGYFGEGWVHFNC